VTLLRRTHGDDENQRQRTRELNRRVVSFSAARSATSTTCWSVRGHSGTESKANPDKAQRPVRARALTEGKVLYMAVPRLADELPFYLLNPERLSMSPSEAAAKEGRPRRGARSRPRTCHRWTWSSAAAWP
jgi:5-formyltetrahydrofolate cyclo-ligase